MLRSGHRVQDYLHQWRPVSKPKKGEHLKTPDGTLATADGDTTPKVHDGWMWDLTVPGNNDHDFYVLPAHSGSRATKTLVQRASGLRSKPKLGLAAAITAATVITGGQS